MKYPARLLSPGEQVIKQFRPHWQVLAPPALLLLAAVIVAILGFANFEQGRWIALGTLILWLVVVAKPVSIWLTTQHVITDERVIYRAGVFSRRGREIPLEVINDVAFTQSVFERVIRSGDLLIESAGEYGQSRYTDIPDPEGLQSLVYQLREQRAIGLRKGGVSTADELMTLERLRQDGVLTDEEFQAQKQKLLEG